MKRIHLTFIFLLLSFIFLSKALAQVPQSFNYQAVVRDNAGTLVQNQNVSLQISILAGAADGTLVFRENHFPATSEFGLVTLEIGSGTLVTGDFTSIDWGSNTYFLQVALDASGGTSFAPMGTTQILSVPYAIYSKTAETVLETGEGSNLDADLLDGHNSDYFLTVNYEETDPAVAQNFNFTGAVNGDLLQFDGTKWVKVTPDYAAGSHNHSATDITSGTLPIATGGTNSSTIGTAGRVAYSNGSAYAFTGVGTAGQVLVSGGSGAPTWTSSPTVTEINYSSPRTHYSTVGEASFRPRNGDEMAELGWGNNGAYLTGTTAPGGGLYAELDVPVGAKVTQIDIGFYDGDVNDRLYFMVNGQNVTGAYGYTGEIGSVATNTSDGAGSVSITDLNYTVDSTYRLRLLVVAETNAGTGIPWPGGNMRVSGVRVHYQISEAF